MEIGEVSKAMKSLDVKKSPEPDGISNWMIKECTEQLVDKADITETSLDEGRRSKD